jgi:hypothetical protein
MAKKILSYPSWDIEGGTIADSQTESLFVQGQFVGMSATGVKLADYRAAQGPVAALGVLRESMQRLTPRGDVISREPQLSWVSHCRVGGFTGLLGQAGNPHTVASTAPATLTGDIDQIVGIALSATELKVMIGGIVKHA